jgi:small subunit ribosomal protein S6
MELLREYETVYIIRPDLPDEEVEKITNRIKGVLQTNGCKITKYITWGKRKLAYEIEKQNNGVYYHLTYLAPAKAIHEFERNLRLMDVIMRFLTVRLDDDVDPDAKPVESDWPVLEKKEMHDRPIRSDDRPRYGSYRDDYNDGGDDLVDKSDLRDDRDQESNR